MYQRQTQWDKIKDGPYITYLFLSIQIIVFLLMEFQGIRQGIFSGSENGAILQQFGAMVAGDVIYNHEFWRFITPIFIHIGLVHLAVNSLTLFMAGRLLEPLIGHTRFFILYLLSGIMGNLVSFAFSSPLSISAGASTSLFGLFAAFIVLGRLFPNQPIIRQVSRNMLLLIVLNLGMNVFSSGVDILGHIGGVIGGVLLMVIVGVPKNIRHYQEKMNPHIRILAGIIFVFVTVFCLFYGFKFK